jgi:ferrous iron transport protein A
MKMTLANLAIGESGIVKDVIGNSVVTKRLMEMGVLPGVTVKIIKTAPFGCPIQIRVRGYDLAIRKSEAESIEIQKIERFNQTERF